MHILNEDEDSGPKFGQVPPRESMSSSDDDSMESDHSVDSLSFRPLAFYPRTIATATTVPSALDD